MRRFAIQTTVFALLQALLLGGFLWVFDGRSVEFSRYAATRVKHDRLEETPSPRLILVGGSSLLMGVDSRSVEAATGFHVVNMGLIAGLRLEFILREVENEVRPNDVVVLGLEYGSLFRAPHAANPRALLRVLLNRPASMSYLSVEHCRRLAAANGLEELGAAFRQAWSNLKPGARPDPVESVNPYGDLDIWHDATVEPPGRSQRPIPGAVDWEAVDASIARVNEFAVTVRDAGAEVVYLFPPVANSHWRRDRGRFQAFHERLARHLDVPIIATQRGMLQRTGVFINSSYHLWGEGVRTHSNRIAAAVMLWKEAGADTSAQPGFEDVLPSMGDMEGGRPGRGSVDEPDR